MLRRAFCAVAVAVCLVAPLAAQAPGDYLDVYIAKVKPEKVPDFTAITKKMVDANRRNNGDNWMAMETVYGEGDTYMFVSTRQDYAALDKSSDAFMGAMTKTYGKDGAEKMVHDWESCLTGSRSEFRKRRWDLSRKAPADATAYAKFVGESRVLRTTAVHLRPGHIAEFEDLLKEIKSAGEQNANTQPLLVSQVMEGGKGTTFYITGLRSSMGGFDKNPTVREMLGEEGYKKYLQVSAESIDRSESMVFRFSPELSNPPQEVIAAAPDFWEPKAAMTATAKPRPAATKAEKAKQQ